jgi:hypothetical protein
MTTSLNNSSNQYRRVDSISGDAESTIMLVYSRLKPPHIKTPMLIANILFPDKLFSHTILSNQYDTVAIGLRLRKNIYSYNVVWQHSAPLQYVGSYDIHDWLNSIQEIWASY